MTHRYRHTAVTLLAVGCTCLVTACGSSSSSGSGPASGSTASGPRGTRVGLKLTATQQSCLKQHGAKVFTGGTHRPGGRPGFGPGSGSGPGSRPTGGPSSARFKRGTRPGGFGTARHRTQLAALKACGVSLPSRGAGGTSAPPAG